MTATIRPVVPEAHASPAGRAAAALLGGLIASGLTDIIVCPGSRSQALALAAAALDRTTDSFHLHVRIDERVAGFTALGLAQETGRPVAVVVTSGTAVAELHPAVLEAHHAGVPLLLLTADRPAELLGIASNQTTDQSAVFGPALVERFDVAAPASEADVAAAGEIGTRAYAAASRAPFGPVQVNLAYREPLSGIVRPEAPGQFGGVEVTERLGAPVRVDADVPTVVLAGDKAGEAAESFARGLGVPLLAEVSSGARFGPNVIGAYQRLLADAAFGGRVERAIVFGHPTLIREVPALIRREDVQTIVVGPSGAEWYDPTRGRATRVAAVEAGAPGERSWLGSWVSASRRLLDATDDLPYVPLGGAPQPGERRRHTAAELDALRATITRRALVDAVWRATWPHDRLVLAASRLIREADSAVPGKRIRVVANRGLAGIDGTVSTAIGVALGAERSGRGGVTRVLIGDLALLHDTGALLLAPGEPRPHLQIVVGNDEGGTIFDSLEVATTADPADFDRVQRTPRPADFAALAAAFGWAYSRVATRAELDRALTAPAPGPSLVEVPLPR
jgi:2-succinyl-5-enolpyruvyl-6-hydroxy-3-cyclohexene-1-carboxylate synthase